MGLHGIWSKERNHGIGNWEIYTVLYPFVETTGELSDFLHHDGVFLLLLVDEKEAPPS